jgi:hypothetical protein
MEVDQGPNWGCSANGKKGNTNYKKGPTPPFLSKEEQRKKEKTEVLTLNKYVAMGPSGARCQE